MKKIVLLLMICIVTLPVEAKNLCMVQKIYDGKVFDCNDGSIYQVWGIDTPKIPPRVRKAEPNGYEAKQYLEKLIGNKSLMCELKFKEKGFNVAQCFLNNSDIAIDMLKSGFSRVNIKESKEVYVNLIPQTDKEPPPESK